MHAPLCLMEPQKISQGRLHCLQNEAGRRLSVGGPLIAAALSLLRLPTAHFQLQVPSARLDHVAAAAVASVLLSQAASCACKAACCCSEWIT